MGKLIEECLYKALQRFKENEHIYGDHNTFTNNLPTKKGSNLLAKVFPKDSLPSSSMKRHIEFSSMLNHSFEMKWFAASKISLDNHRGQKL